jgi:hypothetical protein
LLVLTLVVALASSFWGVKLQREKRRKEWIEHPRYTEVQLFDAMGEGGSTKEPEPPSEDEVTRALEIGRPVTDRWPFLYVERINVRMVVKLIDEEIEPPRVYPLVGPAQCHRMRYMCRTDFTEATRIAAPISYTTTMKDCFEVVYISHDHLHLLNSTPLKPDG